MYICCIYIFFDLEENIISKICIYFGDTTKLGKMVYLHSLDVNSILRRRWLTKAHEMIFILM